MQQLNQYVTTKRNIAARSDAAGFLEAPQDLIYGGYSQMGEYVQLGEYVQPMGAYINDDAPRGVGGLSLGGLDIPWWLVGLAGIVGYMYATKRGPFKR